MPPKKTSGPTIVESFKHEDKRTNIPTADSHDLLDEQAAEIAKLRYPRNPELDPQLVWKGKDAQDSEDLVVDAPPIYIQEKIDPRVLIENLRRTAERPEDEPELTLFDTFDGLEGFEAVEYYKHQANWSNRMILGDSLQVMGSLVEKENLRGKVQMIYIDPPYGIKFGSNFQPSMQHNKVRDGKPEDVTREVEQIKAFRDTWKHGIGSYLTYLRDRFIIARDLLTESGSVFVQIGDENVHLVRSLLDEIFGNENFASLITFKTTSGAGSFAGGTNVLAGVTNYILWYAKKLENVKYRQLFQSKGLSGPGASGYSFVELPDGQRIRISSSGQPPEGRVFTADNLTSQTTRVGQTTVFPVEVDGVTYSPNKGGWKTNRIGMERLKAANRLIGLGKTLRYVRYLDDFPAFPYNNSWDDTTTAGFGDPKIYVVQTNTKVIERCLLMTTDPGDLVLDPTCGAGTTAYSAEQWGRRWITIDTSRVALALARQRLMSALYPYYLLADSREGQLREAKISGHPPISGGVDNDIRRGFVYKRIPHIGLKSIANNPDLEPGMTREQINAAIKRHSEQELLYDQPYEDKSKLRVSGPFTVESLAPHKTIAAAVLSRTEQAATEADASSFEQSILDNLAKAGVQNGRKNERLEFESLIPFAGELINAEGIQQTSEKDVPQRIAVSIGPQYGTVNPEWIRRAAREALRGLGFDLLIVCAFAFDPQAIKTTEEFKPNAEDFASVQEERKLGKLPVLLVRMNTDLVMADVLKKTDTGNLFMVFGEPDIALERTDEGVIVEVRGIDVYDPTRGEIRSNGTNEIAMWMIDTDYDGESFFVRHCYFTGGQKPYERLKKALKADIDEAAWEQLYTTRSQPFRTPDTGKIAVKVINHYGDEVLQVYDV
ncbi:Possible DNA methylase [[Actinomadura] parvosata subsp. kistnae]|uniref:Site-specific DNA-methyltransferase n=1 Tax=[Actinomadura] parvosata subsp. kistnae TaxID=1909395 RepID=A0A1V0AEI5_9ACTN|nr:site-specific DNA-methyltransferase [Nonomuraea sp. ATCC 55076]AQZ68579.1 site-specific DNA-methyltransferase [Nonomuraea sp. ATCC 55076]SPL92952.1 Possible DNA methylase [Actinomadura parvosata subsp. kistnae]